MKILEPLYSAVTFVMVTFHTLFKTIGFSPGSGWAWALSIVGLVVVIRIVLIPLFVKQIKAQRGLQMLQPEIKKIQAKYKGKTDSEAKQKQSQEMMKLYKDTGTNPLSSCLPIIAQAPIFFALFQVLNGLGHDPPRAHGFLTGTLVDQASAASIFGVHLSDRFLGAPDNATKIVTAVMIVLMSATTFLTQKQLMTKNMPAGAMDNPFAQQQKIMLYLFPVIFAVSGVNFPVGVLLYWLTTNVWSMGQQFYVIRRMPAPGSAAAESLERRLAAKAAKRGGTPTPPATPTTPVNPAGADIADVAVEDGSVRGPGQRAQPRRQRKRKR